METPNEPSVVSKKKYSYQVLVLHVNLWKFIHIPPTGLGESQ
jgi:hypothetical protein